MRNETFYLLGNEARYTGEHKLLYGEVFWAGVFLEGHRKDETIWTRKAPMYRLSDYAAAVLEEVRS